MIFCAVVDFNFCINKQFYLWDFLLSDTLEERLIFLSDPLFLCSTVFSLCMVLIASPDDNGVRCFDISLCSVCVTLSGEGVNCLALVLHCLRSKWVVMRTAFMLLQIWHLLILPRGLSWRIDSRWLYSWSPYLNIIASLGYLHCGPYQVPCLK